jgi:hypothetical protein
MKRTPYASSRFRLISNDGEGPIYPVIVAGETVHVSGLPPFDPETGAKA